MSSPQNRRGVQALLAICATAGLASVGFAQVPSSTVGDQDPPGGDSPARAAAASRQETPDRLTVEQRWSPAQLQQVADGIAQEIELIGDLRFHTPVTVQLADKLTIAGMLREFMRASASPHFSEVDEMRAKLLGMIPPDMDLRGVWEDLIEEQANNFYDPATGVLYLLESQNSGLARMILARELAGVLHGQHYDLEASMAAATSDQRFALEALSVGSAAVIAREWRRRHIAEMDLKAIQTSYLRRDFASLSTLPPYVWRPQIAQNMRGNAFLCRSSVVSAMLGSARLGDIKRSYANPPLSSEQILHPVKYWKPDRRDDPETIEVDTQHLEDGWEVVDIDTLGELYLGILTEPFEARRDLIARSEGGRRLERYTSRATDGWSGDAAVLLERDGGYLLVLQTRWDEVTDAAQFYSAVHSIQQELATMVGSITGFEGTPHDATLSLDEDARSVTLSTWVGLSQRDVSHALRDLRFK